MGVFITLREAAAIMASDRATDESVEIWISLLATQDVQLKITKAWTTSPEAVPGGVSFERPQDEWRIPRPAFNAWREANGYTEQARPQEISPLQPKELPEKRYPRVGDRCDELQRQGVRAWLKTVAKEEGVSTARIKQILQILKAAQPNLGTWGALKSSKTRTS